MDNAEFEKLVAEGLDTVPEEFLKYLENVAILVEDNPTFEQERKLQLRPYTLLFGLYEGISLKGRVSVYNSSLPDKITIFKNPILALSRTPEDVKEQVRKTVIHEIAHHLGMNEQEVRAMERRKGA